MTKYINSITATVLLISTLFLNPGWTYQANKLPSVSPSASAKEKKNNKLSLKIIQPAGKAIKPEPRPELEPKPKPLPKPKPPLPVASRSSSVQHSIPAGYSAKDLLWLSRIIHAEAKGEPLKGKVAVGAVILNRVEHKEFPATIYSVIHQQRNGNYQFQPVANGKINNRPDSESIKAAELALNGKDPTNGALFFYNPSISRSQWMARLKPKTRIGHHIFASKS